MNGAAVTTPMSIPGQSPGTAQNKRQRTVSSSSTPPFPPQRNPHPAACIAGQQTLGSLGDLHARSGEDWGNSQ